MMSRSSKQPDALQEPTPLQTEPDEMDLLCDRVQGQIEDGDYKAAEDEICYAMYLHPHAAQPHNLMGILLETQGRHVQAMQHFRAAIDLNPTYRPARENLYAFAELNPKKHSLQYRSS